METKSARPILRIPYSITEKAFEVLSVAAVIFSIAVLVRYWAMLPSTIPTHFGASGRPDAWGSKGTLVLLPILSTFLYLILTVVARFPHTANYPFPITPENARHSYQTSRTMIGWLKIDFLCALSVLEFQILRAVSSPSTALGIGSMVVAIVAFVVLPIPIVGIGLRSLYAGK